MKSMDETRSYYQSYYERVVKPKREAEKAAKQAELAQAGIARERRGRKRKYGPHALDLHLKFSDELSAFIREDAATIEWQEWFDALVREKMKRVKEEK